MHHHPPPNGNGEHFAAGNGNALQLPASIDRLASNQPETAINRTTVLQALRRRWLIVLLVGLVVSVPATFAAWMLIPAPYTAFSEIRVHREFAVAPGRPLSPVPDYRAVKQTQMKLAISRDVLMDVLRKPEVNRLSLIRDAEDQLAVLEETLSTSASGPEYFKIKGSGRDPREMQVLVKAATDSYMEQIVDRDRVRLLQRHKMYGDILATARERLGNLNVALDDLAKNEAATQGAAQEKYKASLDRKNTLQSRLTGIELEIRDLTIRRDILVQRKKNKKPQPIPNDIIDRYIAESPEFVAIQKHIEQLKSLLDWQKRELTKNHPDIPATAARLKHAEKDLQALRSKSEPKIRDLLLQQLKGNERDDLAETDRKLTVLNAKKESVEALLKKELVVQSKFGVRNLQIERQKKDIERQQLFTDAIDGEVKRIDTQLSLLKDEPRITVALTPELPRRADLKKQIAGTILAGLGSFGLVAVLIVLMDVRLRRVGSVRQITERIGLPIVGAMPMMPYSVTSKSNGRWSARARYWHGVLTESIDSARTILLKEVDRNAAKVLMIASATGGEGKTTVSCHLATSLARTGRKVLLIDGDMRRPFIHRTFGVPVEPGLSEILRGEAPPEEAVTPTDIEGLSILPGGLVDQNSLNGLAEDGLGKTLADLREDYDVILIDSAPVLLVTDSLLIAQDVDAALFSIRRDVSRVTKVTAACQRLGLLGVPILGAVAVGLDDVDAHYFGYRNNYAPYGLTPSA
ncbi:MAG: polysaccharide biosynthesis tyrosine autokinase [Planctomycetaceae bacterium]